MEQHNIVIMGGNRVGKSALYVQFREGHFVEEYDPTIEDGYRKQATIDGKTCVFDFAEIREENQHSPLISQITSRADGFLFVYSITSRSSFEEIPSLRDHILRIRGFGQFPLILVGNKCDLNEERQVMTGEGQDMAQSFGCPFLETSAKTPINVDLAFHDLVREIRRFVQMASSGKPKKDCLIL